MEKYIYYNLANNVVALTTTKKLGNLAYQVSDDISSVKRARAQLSNDIGLDENHIIFVHQSHSDRIQKVDQTYLGMGKDSFESGPDCDALYTKEKHIALAIFHADCVPILFYAPSKNIVGIIHAGYKGTIKEVVLKALGKVIKDEHLDPKEIKVQIGPYLHKEFYDITKDEKKFIENLGYGQAITLQNNKIEVDVCLINEMQLEKLGILGENISISDLDTGVNDNLFSAYKNHPIGRMASLIFIK